jgi:predicted dehydrogenase
MDTVRVGFVGAGGIARAHAEALAKVPDAEIVAVTDVDESAAKSFGEKYESRVFASAEEMATHAGLDALFLLVPPFARGEGERAALKNNLPFLIEKPVGLDMGFLNEVASEVAARKLITSVGYMNRYRKGVLLAKKLLTEEPGIMAYGGWWGGTPNRPGHWWPDKTKSGGQLHEQVTHTVDLARFFFGEAVEVYAAGAHGFVKDIPGYSMDDAASVTFRFEHGAIATIMASVTTNVGGGVFLNVHSMNRTFRFREWEHSLTLLEKDKETVEFAGEPDIFAIEDAAFIEAVRRGDPSPIRSDYADGVKSAHLSLAANESMESGKVVEIK